MFNFFNLYSGSSGNCSYIETENTKILVDCGETTKKTITALESHNISAEDLDAIIVTHEHADHVKSIGTLSKKYNIPVYANAKTWNAMQSQAEKIEDQNKKHFKMCDHFEIGDLNIVPFSIPHDAADPCGFNIYHDDKKISIATDLGHMTPELIKNMSSSLFILLESNYDPEILKYSPYPYSLKRRILGPNGHLSNQESAKTVSFLMDYGAKQIMLGHLSKENNFPELAYKTVMDAILEKSNVKDDFSITVASRTSPSPIIEIA